MIKSENRTLQNGPLRPSNFLIVWKLENAQASNQCYTANKTLVTPLWHYCSVTTN